MLTDEERKNIRETYKQMVKAGTTRPVYADGAKDWYKVPYQVKLGNDFKTMAEAWNFKVNADGSHIKYSNVQLDTQQVSVGNPSNAASIPDYINNPYFRDTRVGASDAINCIWQFNRDDDIVHPVNKSISDDCDIGLGRVYAGTTEQNQSIAWFTFGVPRFTPLASFYANAAKKDLIAFNQTGSMEAQSLGYIFGRLGALAFRIAIWPLTWIVNFTHRLQDYHVDRFYDLRATMHVYYKYVDSILAEWLVNTGIYGTGKDGGEGNDTTWTADPSSLPIAMQATGPSIWNILATKAQRIGGSSRRTTSVLEKFQDIFKDPENEGPSSEFESEANALINMKPSDYDSSDNEDVQIWSGNACDWGKAMLKTALGATQFVGFRIEKNVDASESFSNSTGPSEMAEKINSMSQEAASKSFDMGGTSESGVNTGIGAVDTFVNGLKGIISGAASIANIDGLASAVMGGAFIDIPEQYKSSDFNKSHSLSFQLRSPYGDITSIYQSIMVPLCMLLAGALPRSAGPNSYTQPFLCRVYCKGIFSIPMGIIDSLSIKRGSSEFGWTYANLPTCIDVSMSIKDLSPMMYMAIKDDLFKNILGVNNSFNEYMLTLAGTGLFERVSRFAQIRRNVQFNTHKVRNQILNPMFWMSTISETALVQLPASFTSYTYIPSK